MEGSLGFALPLCLSATCALDIRSRAIVLPIEEQHSAPEIDRVTITVREVLVEPRQQQLFDPRIAFERAQRLGRWAFGAQRIHGVVIIAAGTSTDSPSACAAQARTDGAASAAPEMKKG
jgi:hypothetical protein